MKIKEATEKLSKAFWYTLWKAICFIIALPYAVLYSAANKKLHYLPWLIHDFSEDLEDMFIEIFLICTILGIPLAIMHRNDRIKERAERAAKWEAAHPGKEA